MPEELDGHPQANVITVLHNSAPTLTDYFAGLEAQRDHIAQVVLVDNGSTDGTAEIARRHAETSGLAVTVVSNDNAGFAGGYAAGGPLVADQDLPTLCLNPDVRLGASVLRICLDALAGDHSVAIVTAPLQLPDGSMDPASVRRHPSLAGAAVYAALGKLTPGRLKYNRVAPAETPGVHPYVIEATTGALMLVSPRFRRARDGIFDTDYWMYGEDLQLCIDAHSEGMTVLMVDAPPSLHVKGVSSGLPRKPRSNVEFHRAMYLYFVKNMHPSVAMRVFVRVAVTGRLLVSLALSAATRGVRELRKNRGLRA
ncbi:glycosyltransferase [Microbacterium binotii]|uniref:glycosyltransferase n=1 Tax=Microbacterium binotii TaxID=462710 RepID=UPI001F3F03F6|nr:glycosyltransferase [Microbacterium binotii]UIN31110.1 glycosyltransferase [Microbacterium binotii]